MSASLDDLRGDIRKLRKGIAKLLEQEQRTHTQIAALFQNVGARAGGIEYRFGKLEQRLQAVETAVFGAARR